MFHRTVIAAGCLGLFASFGVCRDDPEQKKPADVPKRLEGKWYNSTFEPKNRITLAFHPGKDTDRPKLDYLFIEFYKDDRTKPWFSDFMSYTIKKEKSERKVRRGLDTVWEQWYTINFKTGDAKAALLGSLKEVVIPFRLDGEALMDDEKLILDDKPIDLFLSDKVLLWDISKELWEKGVTLKGPWLREKEKK